MVCVRKLNVKTIFIALCNKSLMVKFHSNILNASDHTVAHTHMQAQIKPT